MKYELSQPEQDNGLAELDKPEPRAEQRSCATTPEGAVKRDPVAVTGREARRMVRAASLVVSSAIFRPSQANLVTELEQLERAAEQHGFTYDAAPEGSAKRELVTVTDREARRMFRAAVAEAIADEIELVTTAVRLALEVLPDPDRPEGEPDSFSWRDAATWHPDGAATS